MESRQPKGRIVTAVAVATTLIVTACAGYKRRPIEAYAPPPAPVAPGTEQYDPIKENAFLDPRSQPLSTFSVDVDTASYANVRRFLNNDGLPPADAVRVEELINYFTYDDAPPDASEAHPFRVSAEVGPCPWAPRHQLVRLSLKGREVDTKDLPRANLVFLLDVSGSMADPDKLPLVKRAMRLLVGRLRASDRVAIVTYAGGAGLVLRSTPGDRRASILEAIDGLGAGGSTAGSAGIRLAYEVAAEHRIKGGNNRVILATDGDFNVGVSSDEELVRLIEEERESGTYLTVLGFGTGNLKDAKMEKLADAGNGNYAYVDTLLEAEKVLVSEMGATLLTIAKDVKIQVEFNPAHVVSYRLVGYENRLLRTEDFRDDAKDAGDVGAGKTVTALYEIVPPGVKPPVPLAEPLNYQKTELAGDAKEILTVKLRYKRPGEDESRLVERRVTTSDMVEEPGADFRFASAVAAFGMLLRESPHRGAMTYAAVADLAAAARGVDREGYRGEFVRLVRLADVLAREKVALDRR